MTDDVSHKHQQHGCYQDTGSIIREQFCDAGPARLDWKENSTLRLNMFRQVPNGAEQQTSAGLCSDYRASKIYATHSAKPFLML